jgi:hypothetical protein
MSEIASVYREKSWLGETKAKSADLKLEFARECWRKAPLFLIGGERGIRTLGRAFAPHSLSRRAPSAISAISPQHR